MLFATEVMAARCFDEEIIVSQRPRIPLMRDEDGFVVHLQPNMAVVDRKGFLLRFDRQMNVAPSLGRAVYSLKFLGETYLLEMERTDASDANGRWQQYTAGPHPRGFAGTCVLDDSELRD